MEELKRVSIVAITADGRVSYEDANIKAFKVRAVGPAKIESSDTWLARICGSMPAQKKFLKSLEGCSKAYLEMPFVSITCSDAPIPIGDIEVS